MKLLILGMLLVGTAAHADAYPSEGALEFTCVAENGFEHLFEGRSKNVKDAMGQAISDCRQEGAPGCRILHCGPES